MLVCVMNVSEGADHDVIAALAAAAGRDLLDVHSDPHHHRSVFTMVGDDAPRAVAEDAVALIDLGAHVGVHPRLGAVDVVPFIPLAGSTFADALAARDAFAAWAATTLHVPCFVYGPERSLPEIRRRAGIDLPPDVPAAEPTRTSAGAMCVGAREVLVAYNVWLAGTVTIETARRIAASMRSPAVRALAMRVGTRLQVSMNLIDPLAVGPAEVVDAITAMAPIDGTELVGLVPAAVLDVIDPRRWTALDLAPDRTIEARVAARH